MGVYVPNFKSYKEVSEYLGIDYTEGLRQLDYENGLIQSFKLEIPKSDEEQISVKAIFISTVNNEKERIIKELEEQIKGGCSRDCPIDWLDGHCLEMPSPFMQWDLSHKDWEDCYKYAKQISELPEKEVE